jgi:hypothetical protein
MGERRSMFEDILTLDQLADEPEEEIDGFDPEADPFAGPPPVDDGKYLVKLTLNEKRPVEKKPRTDGLGNYFRIGVVAVIQDPGGKFDGRMLFDDASTLPFGNSGSTRVAGILKALNVKPLPSASGQALQLCKALEAGPAATVKTQWEVSYKEDDGSWKRIKGQKNFLKYPNGSPMPIYPCPNGEEKEARATIRIYEKA